ncbi:hypothetical protein DPMN_058189 [Dreissena polymorpha]|uniref:Uncharacterized protein n=1 Tax=Dreissena polymorpha TaxID=45954 RepID=A0A9D4C199_DREPO|nr:hypothetical protein DPMN_058189 [Dreissena polymorpha]
MRFSKCVLYHRGVVVEANTTGQCGFCMWVWVSGVGPGVESGMGPRVVESGMGPRVVESGMSPRVVESGMGPLVMSG